jgi:hypothetical protein
MVYQVATSQSHRSWVGSHQVIDELEMRPKRLGEARDVAVFVVFPTSDFLGDTLIGAIVDYAHCGILSSWKLQNRGSV